MSAPAWKAGAPTHWQQSLSTQYITSYLNHLPKWTCLGRAWGGYNLANQGPVFISKSFFSFFLFFFSSHPESNAVLLVYDTLAPGSAFRVQLELIWFIVHALLKRYSYLQHRRKSPSQGALTHIQTHPHRHSYHSPMHPHQ